MLVAVALFLIGFIVPASAQPDWVHNDVPVFEIDVSGPAAGEAGPEILDPFFAFCIGLIEGDSLGVWNRGDIEAWIQNSGETSALPIDRIIRVERTELPASERETSGRERAWRRFRLVLDGDLQVPLPYSILGYHPGDLHVSRELAAIEWSLDHHELQADVNGPLRVSVKLLRALRLDEGWVVLDVDGWLDRLLGGKLDDTWFEAFVVARAKVTPDDGSDELVGMALGRSRKDRPLVGSFDFRRNKVLPNGLPVARVLSGYVRPIVAPLLWQANSRAWSWPLGR